MGRAIFFSESGGVDVFKVGQIEDQTPADEEVFIQHTAIGVNYIDVQFRSGKRALSGANKIIGYEACGVVKAVGSAVKGFTVGSKVAYATAPIGAYRDTRCVNQKYLVAVPDDIDDKIVAASFFKGLTAHYLVCRAFIAQPGHRVLIHSAAGGVGHLLCQWANHIGAIVIGTVSHDDKKQFALENGCHYVFNRKTEDWASEALKITKGVGVNAVYDGIGKETFDGSIKALMKFGILVLYGASSGVISNISYNSLASKSIFFTIPSLFDYKENRMELALGAADFFKALQEGLLKVCIGGVYPLDQVGKAHALLESGQNIGSIVLTP